MRALMLIGIGTALSAMPGTAGMCTGNKHFNDYLNCRIENLMADHLNQVATEKQAGQPSVTGSSQPLLDRTSASDLIGAGLKLFGSGNTMGNSQSGDGTVTASAYALYTGLTTKKLMDPSIYDSGVNWRRLSVTVGQDTPKDGELKGQKSTVAGAKFLIVNNRDVSKHKAELAIALVKSGPSTNTYGTAQRLLRHYLYETLGPRIDKAAYPSDGGREKEIAFFGSELDGEKLDKNLALLTPDEERQVDSIITGSGVVAARNALGTDIDNLVRKIRTAPQFSIAYTGKIGTKAGTSDTHRVEAIYDWGFSEKGNLTLNGSFDYFNSPKIGADTRSVRVAAESQFELNHDAAFQKGVQPYLLAFSGESKWSNSFNAIYRVQARLEIPIAKGLTFPISVTRANRTELIKEAETRGQFGFTLDAAKLAGLLGIMNK